MICWLPDAGHDLRFAARAFRKRPGFTAVAVLTLALGIGAATAVFSIVDAVLLRPLPYRDPGRLVAIWDRGVHDNNLSKIFAGYGDFEEFQRHAHSFENISAATWAQAASAVLTGRGPAQQVLAIPASATFFETLGVRAEFGRTFSGTDEPNGCAVVLAHDFWKTKLGGDGNVVGQSLILDQKSCAVLGVMPADFSFYPHQASLWRLLGPDFKPNRDKLIVGIFARLKPGVSIAQAQTEVAALHGALHQRDGQERDIEPAVNELHGEFTFLAGRTLRATLLLVFGAVGFVLLIACLNVANLLLGRLSERQRELAVRAALGSGQARLVRQLLTEGLLLAAMGTGLGVTIAAAAADYFDRTHPIELTIGADVRMNLPVLLFSAAAAILTTLMFALLPALRASRVDLTHRLKAAGRGTAGSSRSTAARAVIAAEVALSFVLLIGAGLLLRSALGMKSEGLGFDPAGVTGIGTTLPMPRYAGNDRRLQFYNGVLARLENTPGIAGAALASKLPPYVGGNQQIEIQGRAKPPGGYAHDLGADAISPRYFEVLKAPLLRGREFDSTDRPDSAPVAIVNQALAREYFAGEEPLGQRVRIGGGDMPWLTVVGVAGNLKHSELMNEMRWVETPILYRPLSQEPRLSIQIAARAERGGTAAAARAIQQALAAADAEVPVSDAEDLPSRIAAVLAYPRFRAGVLSLFAFSALLLAAVGLHGVISQLVTQRTPEFGVRRAVGAQTRDLLWLVARQGGTPVLAGLGGGVCCALAFGRLLAGLLYGVRPDDPRVLAMVAGALVVTAALAIAVPAVRAARADPMTALREE